jgi:hypothetical protein
MNKPSGLSRRRWLRLAGAGSLGIIGTACSDPSPAPSSPSSSTSSSTSTARFQRSASIPNIIAYNNIDTQRCLEWCWAACAETIVRQFNVNVNGFYGYSVAQEYFAAKVYGAVTPYTCHAALPNQMAYALTDSFPLLGSSRRILLEGFSYFQNIPLSFNAKAVSLIKSQIPWSVLLVPVGESNGHFLTVYAMQWTEDAFGNVLSVDSYTMADPAQFLYPFLPNVRPYPSTFVPGLPYFQAGVVWAERVG